MYRQDRDYQNRAGIDGLNKYPKTTKHRLANSGKVDLHIIETQTGEYIEEDDIKRYEDEYGRK